MTDPTTLYDDGAVTCDDTGITIRWYYPWGAKHIAWTAITDASPFTLTSSRGRYRIWGSGDLVHWYNLDVHRSSKTTGIDLDLGRRVHPRITPDDPDRVLALIDDRRSR